MGTLNVTMALRRAILPRRFIQLYRSFTNVTNPLTDINASASKKTAADDNSVKLDPFGIEDIDDRSSTVLVQGFYEQNWKKPNKKKYVDGQEGKKPNNEMKPDVKQFIKEEQEEETSKLKEYDGWLKLREQESRAERLGGPSENYREMSFGDVRLDTDNIVENHGQYDESYVKPTPSPRRSSQRIPENMEELSQKKLTAYEFLKQFKKEKTEEIKQAQTRTVETRINPRLVKRQTQEELDNDRFAERLMGPNNLDSNLIPTIYQLPSYNNLTKHDMWNILRKNVVYQNDFILAIDKPPGVPIHSPANDCRHFVTEFLEQFAEFSNCQKVFPLHRLDKETSGVLLFAKDQRVASYILEKFSLRQVDKKYLAITKMCPRIPEGTIKIPIGEGRVGGTEKYRQVLKPDLRKYEIRTKQKDCKEAITHFKVLSSVANAAFLEVRPESGLKHQIRLHLGLGIGCPIIGDHKYSHRDRMAPQRLHPHLLHRMKVKQSKVREIPLHLHCNSISFTLPEEFTKSAEPIYVHAKAPRYFMHTLHAFGLK